MASRWRPKNRRQILQLESDEGSQSPSIQASTSPAVVAPAAPANKLHALLGHYNSDDESSENEDDAEFKDFMNEIKSSPGETLAPVPSEWQELWDPQSGQPYYWHTVTNQLTWDRPQQVSIETQPRTGSTKGPSIKSEQESSPSSQIIGPLLPAEPTTAAPTNNTGVETKKEKISFKIGVPSTSTTTETVKNLPPIKQIVASGCDLNQAKTNGRLSIDVDSIIAAIEREVPPDHVSKESHFVPLFKRRPQNSNGRLPTLGNNFKEFFPPNHQAAPLDLQSSTPSPPPAIVNTFRGFGYHGDEANNTAHSSKVLFVAGEVLKPMVVVPPVVPLTLPQKVRRLEDRLSNDAKESPEVLKMAGQLEILKDAWNRKKLEADYLEEWLDKIENDFQSKNEETAKVKENSEAAEGDHHQQVIDMVLEDSGSDPSDTPPPPATADEEKPPADNVECLDSALNSFYTDLASMDQPETLPSADSAVTQPIPAILTQPDTVPAGVAVESEESSHSEPVKGIKRMKMSSDMTSLVAKWQKIHQANS